MATSDLDLSVKEAAKMDNISMKRNAIVSLAQQIAYHAHLLVIVHHALIQSLDQEVVFAFNAHILAQHVIRKFVKHV
jgi:hypothetical protein